MALWLRVNIAVQTCSVCDSHHTSEVWTRSDNGHWHYNSLQFSGERANFMAPAWPSPLTYVRAFDNFSSLKTWVSAEQVWGESDKAARTSLPKYKTWHFLSPVGGALIASQCCSAAVFSVWLSSNKWSLDQIGQWTLTLLTYVRPFDKFESLRPSEQPQWVL